MMVVSRKLELESTIRDLYSRGWNQKNIAKTLEISNSAVCKWIKSWGIIVPSKKKELEFIVRELHSRGWSQALIGEKVGVSDATIGKWLKSWDLKANRYMAPAGLSWPNEIHILKFLDLVDITGSNNCWNWIGDLDRDGYGIFDSAAKCTNSMQRAHRFSFALSSRLSIPKGGHILHSCDNRKCTNPDHLRLGTVQDNMKDKVSRNRQARGIKNGKSKLDEEIVKKIRKALSSGESQVNIAESFGVGQSTISSIKCGQTWVGN